MSVSISDLICPHIDKKMAKKLDALFYCGYDEMPFESMRTHCRYCPEYARIWAAAKEVLGRRKHG